MLLIIKFITIITYLYLIIIKVMKILYNWEDYSLILFIYIFCEFYTQ